MFVRFRITEKIILDEIYNKIKNPILPTIIIIGARPVTAETGATLGVVAGAVTITACRQGVDILLCVVDT